VKSLKLSDTWKKDNPGENLGIGTAGRAARVFGRLGVTEITRMPRPIDFQHSGAIECARILSGGGMKLLFGAGIAALLLTAPLMGHHSFAAEYDSNKPVTVKGVVKNLAWVNPHAYLFIDVTDENGKVSTWAFETLSPNALARQGWNRNSLKPGDQVTVEGYMAKDGKPLSDGSIHANSRLVMTADGKKVFQGTSADEAASAPSK
jgi:hypothetical protein